MLFYLRILFSLITIISTVSYDLFLPNSIFVTINNQVIVRRKRPRKKIKEKIEPDEPRKKESTCPKNYDNLEILVGDLILGLPGYVNREIQRERQPNEDYLRRNVIIAGRPEFEPLPIDYTPFLQEDIKQVFVTTLERQYRESLVIEVQRFHWLFLRENDVKKWELVNMFSIEESLPENIPPQPEDSSNGVFARGIRDWLEGCFFTENQEI